MPAFSLRKIGWGAVRTMAQAIIYVGRDGPWLDQLKNCGFRILFKPSADDVEAPDGVDLIDDLQSVWEILEPPRFYMIDCASGEPVDQLVDQSYVFMEPGDCVLDTTVSYWSDTLRRYRRMRHRALYYIDLAMAGPMPGGTLLAGGEPRGIDLAADVLAQLAKPGDLLKTGYASSAHFAVTVLDAVANARDQALGEAQQMLEAFPLEISSDELAGLGRSADHQAQHRQHWLAEDAAHLQAPTPMLISAAMAQIAEALDNHEAYTPLPKVGPFVDPEKIL